MMGEKGFSQSGWRETNHQLNLQRNPTSSVLKPCRKGGCDASGCCFSAILSTPDERSKPRGWGVFQIFVDICTLILQEKMVEMVFQNWRFIYFMVSHSTFKPWTYFPHHDCPISHSNHWQYCFVILFNKCPIMHVEKPHPLTTTRFVARKPIKAEILRRIDLLLSKWSF